jgi:hypothetical protein
MARGKHEGFVELTLLSNREAARRLAAEGVHILVDMQV